LLGGPFFESLISHYSIMLLLAADVRRCCPARTSTAPSSWNEWFDALLC
jgi:hypothetical protein